MVTKKIIDPNRIKLRSTEVLCILKEVPSSIITVTSTDQPTYSDNYYLEVVKVGEAVSFVSETDIILYANTKDVPSFECSDGEHYIILRENSIMLVIPKDNFNL